MIDENGGILVDNISHFEKAWLGRLQKNFGPIYPGFSDLYKIKRKNCREFYSLNR